MCLCVKGIICDGHIWRDEHISNTGAVVKKTYPLTLIVRYLGGIIILLFFFF